MSRTAADLRATRLLRQAHLRATLPRRLVLAALLGDQVHLDLETLRREVAKRLGPLSPQTLYNVVHVLEAAGLVRALYPTGAPRVYEAAAGAPHHHHLICRRCGTMVDVPCRQEDGPCLQPAETAGFAIERADVTFWGLCPTCRQQPATQETTNQAKAQTSPRRQQQPAQRIGTRATVSGRLPRRRTAGRAKREDGPSTP